MTLPVPSATYLERFEGMLVRMPQTLYVTEHFQLGRFGQVVMSSGGRVFQPTALVPPGPAALALQASNDLNRLIVDDALQNQNPDPILFGRGGNPLSAANTLRGGDTATGMIGVMSYTWAGNSASGNAYRLRPVGALGGGVPNFVAANARPAAAPDVGGSLRVVGMNLLNFFNTFGVNGCNGGVGGAATDCRGADDPGEFARQWPKTVAAILGTGGDVIGIGEIENDGYGPTSAIQFLVDRLNEATAPGTYAFVDADAGTGQLNALGTDAIKVGFLYKPAKVTPIGATAALNSVAFVNGGDSGPRNRPALAQAFRENATGAQVVVMRQPPQEQGQRMRRAGRRRRPGQLRDRPHERREPARRLARERPDRDRHAQRADRRRPQLVREGEPDRGARGEGLHEPRRGRDRAGRRTRTSSTASGATSTMRSATLRSSRTSRASPSGTSTLTSRACSTTTTTSSRPGRSRRSTRRTSSASPTTTRSSSA